jgi:hypothetical protein
VRVKLTATVHALELSNADFAYISRQGALNRNGDYLRTESAERALHLGFQAVIDRTGFSGARSADVPEFEARPVLGP